LAWKLKNYARCISSAEGRVKHFGIAGHAVSSEVKTIMPLLKLDTTVVLSDDKKKALLAALSKTVAETIDKPEQYIMVVISSAAMLMAGKPDAAAFVDLRSIGGLNDAANQQLSQNICNLLSESLGVPRDRIYLNFTDVPASNWGWNGETFG
jgi:phenylpyruvate tautomerase PptA (4-oxalocrotonate tautomerase family)